MIPSKRILSEPGFRRFVRDDRLKWRSCRPGRMPDACLSSLFNMGRGRNGAHGVDAAERELCSISQSGHILYQGCSVRPNVFSPANSKINIGLKSVAWAGQASALQLTRANRSIESFSTLSLLRAGVLTRSLQLVPRRTESVPVQDCSL